MRSGKNLALGAMLVGGNDCYELSAGIRVSWARSLFMSEGLSGWKISSEFLGTSNALKLLGSCGADSEKQSVGGGDRIVGGLTGRVSIAKAES